MLTYANTLVMTRERFVKYWEARERIKGKFLSIIGLSVVIQSSSSAVPTVSENPIVLINSS